ncbi:hypothetical protein LZ31DRAFT_325872 [Colletotrichum somersetense]|nr:hypothetical protein LZ31DRAFT_325872 [Colletotrichum somersetense]
MVIAAVCVPVVGGVSRDGRGGGMRVRRERERRWRKDSMLPFWRGREDVKLRCAGGCVLVLSFWESRYGRRIICRASLSVVICTVSSLTRRKFPKPARRDLSFLFPPRPQILKKKREEKKRERERCGVVSRNELLVVVGFVCVASELPATLYTPQERDETRAAS